ncbi:MAG: LPS export ABC transporter permease LptF [Alphaproteobacteria bacterium]|nr:LPS export ABC transporter permease LptF [Alphaproteobacteria bacterium]
MKIFDRYLFRHLFTAAALISLTLAVIIFLTQSLDFLELVIDSGASAEIFWILTFLALPRFFEIILPLALMAGTVFVYNRMTMDSELIAIRAGGYSPIDLARPALILAMLTTVFLWGITLWAAPRAMAGMQQMQQTIKEQFSAFLFREGVFNQVGRGLTIYIHARSPGGDLRSLMIHENPTSGKPPSTILARRGALVAGDKGHQVVVYDGTRQQYDPETKTLQRLSFDRYTIELPDAAPMRERWREPDERTIGELLNPDMNNQRDVDSLRDFRIEIHRRLVTPLLALAYTLISCAALLPGPMNRRGQSRRTVLAMGSVILIQGLFLSAFNLARQTDWGLPFMYMLAILPMMVSLLALTPPGHTIYRRIFHRREALS